MTRFIVPVAVVLALIAGSTLLEGWKMERWAKHETTAEQKVLAERMNNIPYAFGDWESVDEPISQRDLEGARAIGHYSRHFRNRLDSSKEVNVLIIMGDPADITAHTPEKCYVSSGFNALGGNDHYVVNVGKTAADFFTNRFHKGESGEAVQNLRIFWSFSMDGNWVARDKWEFQLAGYSTLVKIYAITELPANSEGPPDESAAVGFLQRFLPVVNESLFAPDKKDAKVSADKEAADSAVQPPAGASSNSTDHASHESGSVPAPPDAN